MSDCNPSTEVGIPMQWVQMLLFCLCPGTLKYILESSQKDQFQQHLENIHIQGADYFEMRALQKHIINSHLNNVWMYEMMVEDMRGGTKHLKV